MIRQAATLRWLAALAVYAFLYLPLLIVILHSFNAAKLGTHWAGFTLHWYQVLFQDDEMLRAAYHSLLIAAVASAASTVLGTLAGLALYRYKLRLFPFLILAPLAIPELLSGVSLLIFFVLINFTLGLASIMLAHIAFCISFVAIVVRSRLAGLDPALAEAARDLGASPWQSFRYVTLPLIAPGIMAGALLAFTLSIDDFVITFFAAGVDASTLPLRIYSMIKITVTPEVNAISTILVLLTLAILAIASRLAPGALRSGA